MSRSKSRSAHILVGYKEGACINDIGLMRFFCQVRCSGEKKGFARCRSLGLNCEYAISMVGRFSAQTRKARLEAARQGGDTASDASAISSSRGTPSASAPFLPQAPIASASNPGQLPSSKHTKNRNDGRQPFAGDEDHAFFLGPANAIPGLNARISTVPSELQYTGFNLPTLDVSPHHDVRHTRL